MRIGNGPPSPGNSRFSLLPIGMSLTSTACANRRIAWRISAGVSSDTSGMPPAATMCKNLFTCGSSGMIELPAHECSGCQLVRQFTRAQACCQDQILVSVVVFDLRTRCQTSWQRSGMVQQCGDQLLIVEIDRKFAGVMSISGISRSNSASTESIRLTISSEVRPTSRRSSSELTGRLIERSASNR